MKIVILIFLVCSFFSCTKNYSQDTIQENNEIKNIKTDETNTLSNDMVTTHYPMNNIMVNKISFKTDITHYVDLSSSYGTYEIDYDIYHISINFFDKSEIFDRVFMYEHGYDLDLFLSLDEKIHNGLENFPHWYFCDNMRKRVINNIILVDSFRFYGSDFLSLGRTVFISTSNYNIFLVINISSDEKVNNIYDKIIGEVPEYFDSQKMWNGNVLKFGEELINKTNKSKVATEWYNETDLIINSLIVE